MRVDVVPGLEAEKYIHQLIDFARSQGHGIVVESMVLGVKVVVMNTSLFPNVWRMYQAVKAHKEGVSANGKQQ